MCTSLDTATSSTMAGDAAAHGQGRCAAVNLIDIPLVGDAATYFRVEDGASRPAQDDPPDAQFEYSAGALRPYHPVEFRARIPAISGRRFLWIFGDGASAEGPVVHHAFPDVGGQFSRRLRTLSRAAEHQRAGRNRMWAARPVVVADHALPSMPVIADQTNAAGANAERSIIIPVDDGYTITLLAAQPATMRIDDQPPVQDAWPGVRRHRRRRAGGAGERGACSWRTSHTHRVGAAGGSCGRALQRRQFHLNCLAGTRAAASANPRRAASLIPRGCWNPRELLGAVNSLLSGYAQQQRRTPACFSSSGL
jgi:hypothetical protein